MWWKKLNIRKAAAEKNAVAEKIGRLIVGCQQWVVLFLKKVERRLSDTQRMVVCALLITTGASYCSWTLWTALNPDRSSQSQLNGLREKSGRIYVSPASRQTDPVRSPPKAHQETQKK